MNLRLCQDVRSFSPPQQASRLFELLPTFFSHPATSSSVVGITNTIQPVLLLGSDGKPQTSVFHLHTDEQPSLSPELWAEHESGDARQPLGAVLSNRYCRYLTVPWDDALLDDAAGPAYLRRSFVDAYGDSAGEWEVCCSDPVYGEVFVACAIERALLAGIRESCAAHEAELSFVRPYFAAAFNRFRSQMPVAKGILAVVEDDVLTVGRWAGGRVVDIEVLPLAAGWHEVLAACVARNRLLEDELGELFVLCPPAWAGDEKRIETAGWKLLAWPEAVADCVKEHPAFALPACAL
jgi:hypothetical protein